MYGVLIPRGRNYELVLLESEDDAVMMYDTAPPGTVLTQVKRCPPGLEPHAGPLPEAIEPEVVEAEPVDAVPIGPGAPKPLPPPPTPRAATIVRCGRCKRQLIGGLCVVHGKDVHRA